MIGPCLSRAVLSVALGVAVLAGSGQATRAAGDFWKGTLAVQQGDCDTALTEFRALADADDGRGWAMMGHMHLRGACLAKDPVKAVEFFETAAELGNDAAVTVLYRIYQGKSGVPANKAKALHWLTIAAERGSADAAYALSVVQGKRENLEYDAKKAAYWLQWAALKRHRTAQVTLGAKLALQRKMASAVMWASLAVAAGDKRAESLLLILRKDASPEQFAEGETRAVRCLASEYADCSSD